MMTFINDLIVLIPNLMVQVPPATVGGRAPEHLAINLKKAQNLSPLIGRLHLLVTGLMAYNTKKV